MKEFMKLGADRRPEDGARARATRPCPQPVVDMELKALEQLKVQ